MNPDQNQYSIDYLNEIAPQPKKVGIKDKFFLLIVGGGLILVIIIGLMLLSSSAAGPTQKMQTLAARMTTLQAIATKAQPTIKSGDLRSTNSNLTLFLTNANRDIVAPLMTNGVDVTKIDQKITLAENGATLSQTLENARLNAVYDRTYANEMDFQLETVVALLKEIYSSTGSKTLKTFLDNTNTNLQPIMKQLSNFSGANS